SRSHRPDSRTPEALRASLGLRQRIHHLDLDPSDGSDDELRDAHAGLDGERLQAAIFEEHVDLTPVVRVDDPEDGYDALRGQSGARPYLPLVAGRNLDTHARGHAHDLARPDDTRRGRAKVQSGRPLGRVRGDWDRIVDALDSASHARFLLANGLSTRLHHTGIPACFRYRPTIHAPSPMRRPISESDMPGCLRMRSRMSRMRSSGVERLRRSGSRSRTIRCLSHHGLSGRGGLAQSWTEHPAGSPRSLRDQYAARSSSPCSSHARIWRHTSRTCPRVSAYGVVVTISVSP